MSSLRTCLRLPPEFRITVFPGTVEIAGPPLYLPACIPIPYERMSCEQWQNAARPPMKAAGYPLFFDAAPSPP